MIADRYVKFILTAIAVELLWLGLRDASPTAHAQKKPAPMEVAITEIRIGKQEHAMLPVIVMGGARSLTGVQPVPGVEPLAVRIPEPVVAHVRDTITVAQPLTVRTGGEPLVVDVMKGVPTQRPGN